MNQWHSPRRETRTFALGCALIALASCVGNAPSTHGSHGERTNDVSEALNPSPQLSDFVLYAQRSVTLAGSDVVAFGDVGVRSAASGSFGAQLAVGGYSNAYVNLLSPSVSLGIDAQVGDVETQSFQNNGGFAGTVTAFPSTMPALPLGVAAGPGGADVTVGAGSGDTLTPGNYGNLHVSGAAYLSAGTYSFASVTLDPQAELFAYLGPVTMNVTGQVATGDGSLIQGVTADQLTINVGGNDGPGGSPSAVSIGSHAQITGLVSAPHGTIAIGDMTVATGAFVGFDIAVGQFCNVSFQTGVSAPPGAVCQQGVPNYVPPSAPLVGAAQGSTVLGLAVSLPMRDAAGLQAFIADVSNPQSPNYRQYMTIPTFASLHGALTSDYNAVVSWASSFGLTTTTYPNNLVVDVSGTVAQLEQALSVNFVLGTRADGSQFYTPDRPPCLSTSLNLLSIGGIDNFAQPRPLLTGTGPGGTVSASDLRSAYLGTNTFANGTACNSLTGAGQFIGLVEFDGFFTNDITTYEANMGLVQCSATVTTGCVQPVAQPSTGAKTLVNGFAGTPTGNTFNNGGIVLATDEVDVDIEMAIAMAPGATVVPVEGTQPSSVLSALATFSGNGTTPAINQISDSWSGVDSGSQQIVSQFAAQGQSFFVSAGDFGAYATNPPTSDTAAAQTCTCACTPAAGGPAGSATETFTVCGGSCQGALQCGAIDNAPIAFATCGSAQVPPQIDGTPGDIRSLTDVTVVGGTVLNVTATQAWQSEAVWGGGGGGLIPGNPLPDFQSAPALASQLISTGARNIPDVAMPATNLYTVTTTCSALNKNNQCPVANMVSAGGVGGGSGTSLSAPLWAGFTALINQVGQSNVPAVRPIGFVNEAFYQIGTSAAYSQVFHDIQSGNNNNACSFGYTAGTGWDGATGLGSPSCGLISAIDQLAQPPQATVVLSSLAFNTTGFNICSPSHNPQTINGEDANGDITITCQPAPNPDGSISTTFVTVPNMEVGCGDSHGAEITVQCSGTGIKGNIGLNVNVSLSLAQSCGGGENTGNANTFSATNVVPGEPQSNFNLACDEFGSSPCANGGPCVFNSFDATVTVSNTGGF